MESNPAFPSLSRIVRRRPRGSPGSGMAPPTHTVRSLPCALVGTASTLRKIVSRVLRLPGYRLYASETEDATSILRLWIRPTGPAPAYVCGARGQAGRDVHSWSERRVRDLPGSAPLRWQRLPPFHEARPSADATSGRDPERLPRESPFRHRRGDRREHPRPCCAAGATEITSTCSSRSSGPPRSAVSTRRHEHGPRYRFWRRALYTGGRSPLSRQARRCPSLVDYVPGNGAHAWADRHRTAATVAYALRLKCNEVYVARGDIRAWRPSWPETRFIAGKREAESCGRS